MVAHAYTEKALVEQSTIEILAGLGWATVSAADETLGAHGTLGRESVHAVVLATRVRAAITKLNNGAPPEAVDLAIDEILRDRVAMGPAAANREVQLAPA